MSDKTERVIQIIAALILEFAAITVLTFAICWGYGRPWEPKIVVGVLATCLLVRLVFPAKRGDK